LLFFYMVLLQWRRWHYHCLLYVLGKEDDNTLP
jgi:hypothetical protein